MRAMAPNADLRPFQSSGSLGFVGGHPHRPRAVFAADPIHRVDLVGDAVGQPVDLDEEHRGGVARVPGADVVLDRPGDLGVHHLERGGHDAGGDDPADRRPRRPRST